MRPGISTLVQAGFTLGLNMSKILDATCSAAGIVTCEGATITEAQVLSDGKQASEGLLIIQNGKVYYLTLSVSDLKTTIEKLSAAVGQIATTLTSIGAGMTGPTTAPPPTLATDVATLNSIKAELDTLKGALK